MPEPTEQQRLVRMGLTKGQATGLRLLWKTRRLNSLLSELACAMKDLGWGPADTYDAARHGLYWSDARDLLDAHFTPHQIATLNADPEAKTRYKTWVDPDELDDWVATGIPPKYILDTLRISVSRADLDDHIHRHRQASSPEDSESLEDVEATVAMLAGLRPLPHQRPCDHLDDDCE